MPAETDIINVALRKIGGSAITDLGDGSPNANVADDLYEEVRDNLLRSHPWNFATKRQKLARMTAVPTTEFDHAFTLPADWLRTVSVSDNDSGTGHVLYRMELVDGSRAILANIEDCYLRYISQVSDPNVMTPDFRIALSTVLAMEMALPVAASNTMHELMARQFQTAIAKAKATDAQGASPERRPRGSWANSRGGFTTVWPR